MQFCEFSIADAAKLNKYLRLEGEFSCENSFVNLWAWQYLYGNRYALCEDMLFVRSGTDGTDYFALPFGGDIARGVELVKEYAGNKNPVFWVQEGRRCDEFRRLFGDLYTMEESRIDADYVYLRDDLAYLKGKKYHSKRNHISAFSKQFDWRYEPIGMSNIDAVCECAKRWYEENADRLNDEMRCEREGVFRLLANMEILGLIGGAIFVGNEAVAFTLGSAINSEVFDIHTEKALSSYSGAYSVINREFALNELGNYTYINREDDLGLEGLRRAKLSYHPERLLKKYICYPIQSI